MSIETVSLAEAKARLSELTERAAAGGEVVITKRGRPVGRLSRLVPDKRPVDVEQLRGLTNAMTRAPESAVEAIRQLRDDARY